MYKVWKEDDHPIYVKQLMKTGVWNYRVPSVYIYVEKKSARKLFLA
jgi:hypothetical protein